MKLGDKQELFSTMFCSLLVFLFNNGYGVRIKHVLRCQDCPVGHPNSCHKFSLAVDVYLTKNGKILTSLDDYREAGEYWESIGGKWGGRFSDAFHFSIEHNGIK